MKQNYFPLRFKSLLMLAFMLLVGQNAIAVNIVGYSLLTGTNGLSTEGVAINPIGSSSITAVGLLNVTYGSSGLGGNGWDNNGNDGFMSSAFKTNQYVTTAVTGLIRGTNTGPRNLKAQYSLNGSSWIDVPDLVGYIDDFPNIVVTNTFKGFKFRFPTECDNKEAVYVRWIQNGTTSIGGGTVTAAGTINMKEVVIQSELFAAPTSQSTQITIVSITPTTITLGCTPGSGNRRYIAVNNVNSFSTPVNDQIKTANTNYSGTGEQVIYVGSGTTVTVNVPSSTNTYWFRYFEYNQLDLLTRYSTLDASVNNNPKLCALPIIHSPTHNYGLRRASLGATIDPISGDVSGIIDRGVFWDYTAGINSNTPNMISHATASVGTYTVDEFLVNRGTTVYYKGYAENESGVILSSESSFNNSPVFTGVDNWETPGSWNVGEVPGANGDATYGSIDDSPTINGTCTLTTDNSVTNLTINSARKLSINAAKTLTVAGTLTNSASTVGLVLKAGNASTANATLLFTDNALNQNVPASVEMYSKANTLGSNHWQYFGVPVQSQTVGTTFAGGSERVRRFNEANFDPTGGDKGLWYPYPVSSMAAGETLLPVLGYEVVQPAAKTYTFRGYLNTDDLNHPLAYTTVPQLADYAGQNIIANPYTAAIDIPTLLANNPGLDEAAVYIYNTGSRAEWEANSGETNPGSNPGTYSVSTGEFAGIFGIPAQIPSMQGFLMKTNSPKTLSIPYSSVVTNTKPQRAPALDQKVATMIDVIGSKFSDRMWIFSEPTCTRNFDNGFDGRKILGYNTQLFAMEEQENYQINAVNDINNTMLGFQAGSETSFKLIISHQNLEDKYSKVYLTDLLENKMVDITASGSEYAFTAAPSTSPAIRFKITTSTTDNLTPQSDEQIKIFGSNGNAVVQNLSNVQGIVFIYNMAGQFVRNVSFNANGITNITNLKAGAYIVKVKTTSNEVNSYIIIR